MKKVKEEKGITLVALVITIIIMLILAGIGISAITGDGGIIRKTQIAVNINELASLKEALDIYYVLNPNDDPVTTRVPKEEITDEVTQTKIVEYQPDVDFITDIKYERLYYLDSEKLNVNNLPEKRYIIDIETGVVFVNNGLEVKEDGTKTYVLAEYERDKNKTNILAEGTKIYADNNDTYVVKENGDMYGVGEISSYNMLGLEWKDEYDIDYTPQKTDIRIVEESIAQDDDFVEVQYVGGAYIFRKKNGEIWGVGNNQNGQLGLGDRVDRTQLTKIPIDNVKKICVRKYEDYQAVYYIKNDGTLWGCGRNKWYQYNKSWSLIRATEEEYITTPIQISYKINEVEQFTDIKDLAIGIQGYIILKNNGEVYMPCGVNEHYSLGNIVPYGTVITSPIRLTTIENLADSNNTTIKQILTGHTTVVLLENGYLYTVGYGGYGVLCNGSNTNISNFQKVLENVDEIWGNYPGGTEAIYLKLKSGQILASGVKTGITNRDEVVYTPTAMPIENIIEVNNTRALTKDGKVYRLHYNENNEYNKQYTNITTPITKLFNYGMVDQEGYIWTFGNTILKDKGKRIYLSKSNVNNVQEIIISYNVKGKLIKDMNNKYYTWGNNLSKQLFNTEIQVYREKTLIDIPNEITEIKNIKTINSRTFIIDQNNNLWYKGQHSGGAHFGANVSENPLGTLTKHTGITDIKNIWDIIEGTLVQKNDGTLWYAGWNNYGTAGIGDNTAKMQYTQITKDNLGNAINWSSLEKIAEGSYFAVALLKDGTIYNWGRNTEGQLGIGHNNNVNAPTKLTFFEGKAKVIDIKALLDSTAFLLENGEVYVTGSNTYGQFGNGTRNDSNIPVKANIDNVKEIIAGGNHIIAIKNDNSVWSWGSGAQGQLGNAKIGDELTPVPAYELAR